MSITYRISAYIGPVIKSKSRLLLFLLSSYFFLFVGFDVSSRRNHILVSAWGQKRSISRVSGWLWIAEITRTVFAWSRVALEPGVWRKGGLLDGKYVRQRYAKEERKGIGGVLLAATSGRCTGPNYPRSPERFHVPSVTEGLSVQAWQRVVVTPDLITLGTLSVWFHIPCAISHRGVKLSR